MKLDIVCGFLYLEQYMLGQCVSNDATPPGVYLVLNSLTDD